MNYGYGKLVQISPFCPEEGPSFFVGYISNQVPAYWVFEGDLLPSELEAKVITKSRGESLRRRYESRKFDWEAHGLKVGRPAFEGPFATYEGDGWRVLIRDILAEWDGEKLAEFVEVNIDYRRGYEKSSLNLKKKFLCNKNFYPKNLRVQAFMKHCPPSPDWICQSGYGVQVSLDNRPEFGLTPYRPMFDEELITEAYRICSEICLCLASH